MLRYTLRHASLRCGPSRTPVRVRSRWSAASSRPRLKPKSRRRISTGSATQVMLLQKIPVQISLVFKGLGGDDFPSSITCVALPPCMGPPYHLLPGSASQLLANSSSARSQAAMPQGLQRLTVVFWPEVFPPAMPPAARHRHLVFAACPHHRRKRSRHY